MAYFPSSLVVTGPVTHYRYLLLDAIFPRKGQVSLLKKLVTDHLFFIPPFLFSLLYTVALLEVILYAHVCVGVEVTCAWRWCGYGGDVCVE